MSYRHPREFQKLTVHWQFTEKMKYTIVPDIHGQADKFENLLTVLGWRRSPAGWRSGDSSDQLIFLGDFIDRGPENVRVLKTVRSLIDSGKAKAVMGNHELNAIHFHSLNSSDGTPLRAHSDKNIKQHQSFLKEFPVGDNHTQEWIHWMATLPLFLEFDGFRAVHACWNDEHIGDLSKHSTKGALDLETLLNAADPGDTLYTAIETTTKGPEADLPDGYSFADKDGTKRTTVRLKWWQSDFDSWADIAMSVPENASLPSGSVPLHLHANSYPVNAKPVFFGHYWMTGSPIAQSNNAICLDYSAGKDGPLIAYLFDDEEAGAISTANITTAQR